MDDAKTEQIINELAAAAREACDRTNVEHEKRFYSAVVAAVETAIAHARGEEPTNPGAVAANANTPS